MSTLLHDYYLPDKNMPMPCKIKNFMGNYRGNFSLARRRGARCSTVATVADRRDGELKIACTKPLHSRWGYGN
jgi:hypothetical protein